VNHEVVRTRGGALAMRSLDAGEVMHPGVGPLIESQRLYVEQSRLAERLRAGPTATLVVFDVGLGAGSNAVAAWSVSESLAGTSAARLELVSFERDLGALQVALAHKAAFGLTGDAGAAARALLADGRHDSARTLWRLARGDVLETLAGERARADVIFWDPFSPRANPALWTVAAFAAARGAAAPSATLFTYSASTTVRVAMLLGGWAVGIGDGIGAKVQTTAAAVDARDLRRPLDRTWLRRLARPDARLPDDSPADAVTRVQAAAQFSAAADHAG
jgi:queuine tRNA-ribosyltransferase